MIEPPNEQKIRIEPKNNINLTEGENSLEEPVCTTIVY